MKQKFTKFFSSLLVILISNNVTAQCTFTATTVSTESICKKTGTITVNAIPEANYTYQIVAGPSTTGVSNSNVFTGLEKGDYTITVSLGGCSMNVYATVTGTYTEPGLLTANINKIACPNGTGCIIANQPTGGRTPYSYSLVAGPVTRPSQSSTEFCGLPFGAYTLQALDSCGVVRTTTYTMSYDTGYIALVVYSWDLRRANCTDLIVPALATINGSAQNKLLKVWYIKPNGDTLKVNGFEYPVPMDTLVGESKTYGTWTALAFDSCGRIAKTTFVNSTPSIGLDYFGQTCTGYRLRISNMWKYNLQVGYRIRRCSDNVVVHEVTQNPQTTFFSPYFDLANSTCYYIEHWNECGDTVRTTYTTVAKPVFNINACQGTACNANGKGSIRVWQDYLSGTSPITYKIIAGPSNVGMTAIQGQYSSWVYLRDLDLGIYQVEGTDACGQKDTLTITLDKPLYRKVEVIQTPNCSGGSNVHLKISSKFNTCAYPEFSAGNVLRFEVSNPYYVPINVVTTSPTPTSYGVWEGDLVNVTPGNLYFQIYAGNDGCVWDTTIQILPYLAPEIKSAVGYVCATTSAGSANFTLTGGKAPYRFRIRPYGGTIWGAWQTGTNFSGITAGNYEINVEDACPNGSITTIAFNEWAKSEIGISDYCANYGSPLTLSASPIVSGVSYQWYLNDSLIGTGSTYKITNYQQIHNGIYKLKQVFPGGTCIDSASKLIVDCISLLSVKLNPLKATIVNNKVALTWSSLQETNGTVYEIEKSTDGLRFSKIGTQLGTVGSTANTYQHADNNITQNQRYYYRIKLIESNGSTIYSNIAKVYTIDKDFDIIQISPIPFQNKLNISVQCKKSEPCQLKLLDAGGKLIYNKRINLNSGLNTIYLSEELKNLQQGLYILEIGNGFNKEIKKIIKN